MASHHDYDSDCRSFRNKNRRSEITEANNGRIRPKGSDRENHKRISSVPRKESLISRSRRIRNPVTRLESIEGDL